MGTRDRQTSVSSDFSGVVRSINHGDYVINLSPTRNDEMAVVLRRGSTSALIGALPEPTNRQAKKMANEFLKKSGGMLGTRNTQRAVSRSSMATSRLVSMRSLWNYDPDRNHDNVYDVEIWQDTESKEYTLIGKWGRRGGVMQEQVKYKGFSYADAIEMVEKLVRQKMNKGYSMQRTVARLADNARKVSKSSMGACNFEEGVIGKYTPQEAYDKLVEEARWESGHGGYTGTIAETGGFKMVPLPPRKNPRKLMDEMMMWKKYKDGSFESHPDIADKWGPCACIEVPRTQWKKFYSESYLEQLKGKKGIHMYIFFGWASS